MFIAKRVIKKRRRTQRIEQNCVFFRYRAHEFRFPMFLSYSSNDQDFVVRHIYIPLLEALQLRIGGRKQANLVCTGDIHITPGHHIFSETSRCFEQSATVLVIVSTEFCESVDCQNELEQAYYMEKPMILCFLEHVLENNLSPLLQQLSKKYQCVHIKMVDEEIQLEPSWDTLCDYILALI